MNCRLSKRLVVSAVIALLQQNSILGQEQLKTQTTQRQENIRTTSHSGVKDSQVIKHGKADKDFSKKMMAAYKTFEVAESLNKQNHFAEAEQLLKSNLSRLERESGPSSPNLCGDLFELAGVYEQQGKLVEARTFGSDHPRLIASLNRLAMLSEKQRNHTEAERNYKRAIRRLHHKP